jgi:hypothetical protein
MAAEQVEFALEERETCADAGTLGGDMGSLDIFGEGTCSDGEEERLITDRFDGEQQQQQQQQQQFVESRLDPNQHRAAAMSKQGQQVRARIGNEFGAPMEMAAPPTPGAPMPGSSAGGMDPAAVAAVNGVRVTGNKLMETSRAAQNAANANSRMTREITFTRKFKLSSLHNKPDLAKLNLSSFDFLRKEKPNTVLSSRGNAKVGEREGNLGKAVVEGIVITRMDTDTPLELHASIPGIRTNKYNSDGTNYAFAIGVNEQSRQRIEVYKNTTIMENKMMKRFGHLTKDSVRATFQRDFEANKIQVLTSSPIIEVMGMSQEWNSIVTGATCLQTQNVEYVLLDKAVVSKVTASLDALIDALPHTDMSKFSIELRRADGKAWNDPTGVQTFSSSPQEQQMAIDREITLSVDVEVTYVLTA